MVRTFQWVALLQRTESMTATDDHDVLIRHEVPDGVPLPEGDRRLVEKQLVPPSHGDEIAEPLNKVEPPIMTPPSNKSPSNSTPS